METEVLKVEIDKETKKKIDEIFKKLGMTSEAAMKIFLHKVVIANGMPFSVTTDAGKPEKRDGDRGDRKFGGRDRGGFGGRSGDRRGGFGDRGGDRRGGGKSFDRKFSRDSKPRDGFRADDRPKVRREKLTLKGD